MDNEINLNVISIKDFAKKIKKPASTIYEWRRKKVIPENCFKLVAGSIFVKVSEMQEFFNA